MTWESERAARMARYRAMQTVLNQRRKCGVRGCPFGKPCPDHTEGSDYADRNIRAVLERLDAAADEGVTTDDTHIP